LLFDPAGSGKTARKQTIAIRNCDDCKPRWIALEFPNMILTKKKGVRLTQEVKAAG
jgi:hypothetical protein